jgi:spermidine synthase
MQQPLDYIELDANAASYKRVWNLEDRSAVRINTKCGAAQIIDTPDFGQVVFIDGEIQSTAADQAFYHQALCRPALATLNGKAKRILILGGGELCTLRQVLSWPDVEHVDMVDYDQMFVEVCKRRLKSWHGDAHLDPRAHIYHEDAWTWTAQPREQYDSIIVDLTDLPLESSDAEIIHWSKLMDNVMKLLRQYGSMTVYVGMYYPNRMQTLHSAYLTFLEAMRYNGRSETVQPYRVHVPSFGGGEAFFLHMGSCSIKDAIDGRVWRRAPFNVAPADGWHFDEIAAKRSILWGDEVPFEWCLPRMIRPL